MKGRKESRASGMPMLEIVISIGIFAVISVFVLQLFLSANTLESKAKDISKAIIYAENIAEALKASKSLERTAFDLGLKEEKEEDISYAIHYDGTWKKTDKKDTYSVVVIPEVKEEEYGNITYADIIVYHWKNYTGSKKEKKEEILFQLKTAVYEAK